MLFSKPVLNRDMPEAREAGKIAVRGNERQSVTLGNSGNPQIIFLKSQLCKTRSFASRLLSRPKPFNDGRLESSIAIGCVRIEGKDLNPSQELAYTLLVSGWVVRPVGHKHQLTLNNDTGGSRSVPELAHLPDQTSMPRQKKATMVSVEEVACQNAARPRQA